MLELVAFIVLTTAFVCSYIKFDCGKFEVSQFLCMLFDSPTQEHLESVARKYPSPNMPKPWKSREH